MGCDVLITGASGFAGWHLTRALQERHEIVATFLSKPVDFERARALALDLCDADATRTMLRDYRPRVVVHAAALTDPNDCEKRPEAASAANTDATRQLAELLDELSAETHLVAFSTDLVYPGDRAFSTERDPVGPVMHYGRTKLAAERAVRARHGPSTVLRCALLYGPRAPHKSGATGWIADRLRRGEEVSLFTDEYRTPVHVADVIGTVERLVGHPHGAGVLNLGGGERLTRFAMGQAVARALGCSPEQLRPARLAESKMPAPRPADVSMDTTRVTALLERAPISFADGVRYLYP